MRNFIYVTEEAVGSVFAIDELIGGYYLRHVGEIIALDRNRHFSWKARFALFPLAWLGTRMDFEPVSRGTKVTETFYFEGHPLLFMAQPFFTRQHVFTKEMVAKHIIDELSGVKRIMESGGYSEQDVTWALDDPEIRAKIKKV